MNYWSYLLLTGAGLFGLSCLALDRDQEQFCSEQLQFCVQYPAQMQVQPAVSSAVEGLLMVAVSETHTLCIYRRPESTGQTEIDLHQEIMNDWCWAPEEKVLSQLTTHDQQCVETRIQTNFRHIGLQSYKKGAQSVILQLETRGKKQQAGKMERQPLNCAIQFAMQ